MTLPEILTIITASTAACVSIINAFRATLTRSQVSDTHSQVGEMGKALNGRLAELLERTHEVAWQAGFREGRQCGNCPLQPAPHQAQSERLPAFDPTPPHPED